jgi:hypothetical protein
MAMFALGHTILLRGVRASNLVSYLRKSLCNGFVFGATINSLDFNYCIKKVFDL